MITKERVKIHSCPIRLNAKHLGLYVSDADGDMNRQFRTFVDNVESTFRCLEFLLYPMSFSTFVSSYCASCLFCLYFNDVVVKNLRTRNHIPPTSSLSNFPCPGATGASFYFDFQLDVARSKCVGSRTSRRVRHCVESLPARCSRKTCPISVSQPKTFFRNQPRTSQVEGLIKLEGLPNRNLDHSRARGK